MKQVKNRRTGDVGELDFDSKEGTFIVICYDLNTKTVSKTIYTRLEGLYEDWEDYEEPKEYWYIDWNGEVCRSDIHDERTEQMKLIGNYFKTKEEAEKAVEKLKAWKRLKDAGFEFYDWDGNLGGNNHYDCCGQVNIHAEVADEDKRDDAKADLDLIFGGKE